MGNKRAHKNRNVLSSHNGSVKKYCRKEQVFAARLADGITTGSCTAINPYRAWPDSIRLLVVNFITSNFNRLQLPGEHSNYSGPAVSRERTQ